MDYNDFLNAKTHEGTDQGFDPVWMPRELFPFQVSLVEWACRKGLVDIVTCLGLPCTKTFAFGITY